MSIDRRCPSLALARLAIALVVLAAAAPKRGARPPASLVMPVRGTMTHASGAGMILSAPGGAVIAPCAGRILFAAPFRSYGRLVMIGCGGGLVAVLGRLDRAEVAAGATVRQSALIGRLGAAPLYFELRRDGRPIDPVPLLRTDDKG